MGAPYDPTKADPAMFARTRARLQRLSDAKIFSGWVSTINDHEAVLRINGENNLRVEDQLFVQAFGDGVTAQFTGLVERAHCQTVTLSYASAIKAIPTKEEVRLKTSLILGEIDASGFKLEFQVVDVSRGGIGIVTKLPLVKGAVVSVAIHEHIAELQCTAEVRYCRPIEGDEGAFRAGLRLNELDRINQARWNRIVENAMNAA